MLFNAAFASEKDESLVSDEKNYEIETKKLMFIVLLIVYKKVPYAYIMFCFVFCVLCFLIEKNRLSEPPPVPTTSNKRCFTALLYCVVKW